MTESDWLSSTDPSTLLAFLAGEISERKLRLFACACCRRIWPLLPDERSRNAVEIAERYGDGDAALDELMAAQMLADERLDDLRREEWKVEAEVEFAASAPKYRQVRAKIAAAQAAREASDENLSEAGGGFVTTIRAALWQACSASSPDPGMENATFRALLSANVDPSITAIEAARQARDGARAELYTAAADAESAVLASILRDIVCNPFAHVRVELAQFLTAVEIARSIYRTRAFDRLPILADALEEAGCTDAEILNHCRQPGEHVRGCWVVDLLLGRE